MYYVSFRRKPEGGVTNIRLADWDAVIEWLRKHAKEFCSIFIVQEG